MKRILLALGFWFSISISAFAGDADVPHTTDAINKGRALFITYCTACHGNNGKSQVDAVSDATDLTEPALYRNGNTNAAMHKSIKEGAGSGMPPWGAVLKNETEIGYLRAFIHSLWPEAQRPALVK